MQIGKENLYTKIQPLSQMGAEKINRNAVIRNYRVALILNMKS